MAKLSQEEVASRFRKEGYTLNSIYKGMRKYVSVICPGCHNWEVKPHHFFFDGNRCPKCQGRDKYHKKYTYEDIKNILSSQKLILLSPPDECIKGTRSEVKYKCQNEHCNTVKFKTILESIKENGVYNCPFCINAYYSEDIVKQTLKSYNLILTSPYYNSNTPISYLCDICGYEGEINFDSIIRRPDLKTKCKQCRKLNDKNIYRRKIVEDAKLELKMKEK